MTDGCRQFGFIFPAADLNPGWMGVQHMRRPGCTVELIGNHTAANMEREWRRDQADPKTQHYGALLVFPVALACFATGCIYPHSLVYWSHFFAPTLPTCYFPGCAGVGGRGGKEKRPLQVRRKTRCYWAAVYQSKYKMLREISSLHCY